jgi:ATP-binding cassette subfamily C protein CydC
MRLLRPRVARLLGAVAFGTLALGSALALAGVSAWLITRAWQMPPLLDLSIAVVAVRTFGISRGLFGYCERLASHDTALRAAGTARTGIYRRLARGPADKVSTLQTGELLARVSADVDAVADLLVRAIVPIGVALLLCCAAIFVIATISVGAGVVLATCLLIAGGLAPWLSSRAVRAQEEVARNIHDERDVAAITALDHALEFRVAGRLPVLIAEAAQRQRDWGLSMDRAAAPAAVATAIPTIGVAASLIGAIVVAIGIADSTAPTTLAILMLLPLSAFEATAMLPAAAVALTRGRIAANRVLGLVPDGPHSSDPVILTPTAPARLVATNLVAGHPRTSTIDSAGKPLTLDLPPGARLVVQGMTGTGKTTLLMTLAGLLPPLTGVVAVNGRSTVDLTESELRSAVSFFAEDAHLFSTTVRDNLLGARGDCSDDELLTAIERVGLKPWLTALPSGLDTVLGGGSDAVSGGQRRRLLLARALLCGAPILLLDEPTEHLDRAAADKLLTGLLDPASALLGPDRTVVIATHHEFENDLSCPRLFVGRDR